MALIPAVRHEYILTVEIRELGSHPETGPP